MPETKVPAKPSEQRVTKETLIGELVAKHPNAAFVMLQYGLHCVGCHVSAYETIEQGCRGHGVPPDAIDALVEDLNAFINEELFGRTDA